MQMVYTENARKRIGKLGPSAINGFLDELPAAQRGRVLAMLPRMQGFRKNSPLELKERAKAFATAISHAADHKYREHDIEWKAFTVAWLCWAKNQFALELDEFDGGSLCDLAEFVVSNAGELNCAREDLERLALFSFLSDDAEGATFIAARPAREELRNRRLVAELPSRVEGISQRLDKVIVRISQVENGQQQAASLGEHSDAITRLEERLREVGNRVGAIEVQETSRNTELEITYRSLRSDIDSIGVLLRESIERTNGKFSTAAELGVEVPKLRHAFNESLQRLDELTKRMSEISTQAATQATSTMASSSPCESWGRVVALVQPTPDLQVKTLDGIAAIAQALAENFCAVGLERDDAESSARIVTSGLIAGQLVNFSGSMADLLADVTCASVFGAGHVECDVPIGLCDGGIISKCEDQLLASPTNSALVLRGANRSAFEVYGAGIRSLVVGRQIGRSDHFEYRALIATACSGPSVLDANESTLDLGPTIDSDHLQWGVPKWKKIRPGALKDLRLQNLYKQHDDMPDLMNTIGAILNGEKPPSTLRRAVLVRALSALELIPGLNDSMRLELLLASWIVPSMRCQGVAEDSIQKKVHQVLKGSELKLSLLATVLKAGHEA